MDGFVAQVDWPGASFWLRLEGQGRATLVKLLGVPVPDEPFPWTNTTPELRQMLGLDPPLPSGGLGPRPRRLIHLSRTYD